MGAEDVSMIVRGGNEKYVKDRVNARSEDDAHEYGHGGYTGTWAEWNGRIKFHSKIFKSYSEAEEFLFGFDTGEKIVQKWGDAHAVQFRNDKGQLNWLVGACVSG